MRNRAQLPVAILAVLIAGVLALPTISQAHRKKFRTFVTASVQNKNQIEGNVTSRRAACLGSRTVSLFSAAGVLEATATTDAKGAFKLKDKNVPAGPHFISVSRRVLVKNRRHKHVCRGAQTSISVPVYPTK